MITFYPPFEGNYPVTQNFSEHVQRAKMYNWKNYNGGIDWAMPTGASVLAAADGVITRVESQASGYGTVVYIAHKENYVTIYAHLLSTCVLIGQRVNRGQVIARSDSTGFSTGPHLHFEARKDNVAFDPSPYLAAQEPYKPNPDEPHYELLPDTEVTLNPFYNLRSGPGTSYKVLATLDTSTQATILNIQKDWVQIVIKAWIHRAGIK